MTETSKLRRRFAPALAALSLSALAAGPVWAQAPGADRAKQAAAFQAYTDAWSVAGEGARQGRLKDALAAGMTYQDAATHAEGVEGVDAMIGRFQHSSPGVTLKLDDLLLWADHGLAKWSMMDPKGGLMMHGYDVVTYDGSARIKSIVGFFDIPAQKAGAAR